MDYWKLLLPFLYLGVLIGSLTTFSYLYRRRKAAQARALQPWFGPHIQRNVYHSLLELQSKPDTKVPDSVLKAALLRRATEDVHRLIQLRNSKPALMQLLQRGSVGDELWQRFQIAEKEMDAEVRDVLQEANALAPQQNWAGMIIQHASEAAHNEVIKRKLKEIEDRRQGEKERWERRREGMREGFMKELEGDGELKPVAKAERKPSVAPEEPKDVPDKKPGSSDDDAVVVESGGPTAPAGGEAALPTDGGGGKKKKKKGNK